MHACMDGIFFWKCFCRLNKKTEKGKGVEVVACGCDGDFRTKKTVIFDIYPVINYCDIINCVIRSISSQDDGRNGLTHIRRNHISHVSKSNFKFSNRADILRVMHSVARMPNVVVREGDFVKLIGVFGQAVGVSPISPFKEFHCLQIVVRSGCTVHENKCKQCCYVVTSHPIASL